MKNKAQIPWWVSNADQYQATSVVLGFVVAVALLGFQCFNWLQSGEWMPLPLVTLFSSNEFITDYSSWYNSPSSWLGVNKIIRSILEKTPLTISFIGAGYFIKSMWEVSVKDYWEKNPREMGED